MAEFPFKMETFFTPGGRENILVEPGEWVLVPGFKKDLPRMYNFELRPDDVWLVGLFKSGNTWASEMIWTISNNADTEKAKEIDHFTRWCFPEFLSYEVMNDHVIPEDTKLRRIDSYQNAVDCKSPRFIRTHLPLSCLPPKLLETCKVVYIYRDLKDCAVSTYKMVESTGSGVAQFQRVVAGICSDLIPLSPWLKHIKEGWAARNHENMLFISYEEMKKDLESVMRKTAKFLNKELNDEQIKKLKDHLSIKNMRENKSINMEVFKEKGLLGQDSTFIRKGEIGDWKNYFTAETGEVWNDWCEKHLSDVDGTFDHFKVNWS